MFIKTNRSYLRNILIFNHLRLTLGEKYGTGDYKLVICKVFC